ncbi:unnamed protein product [Rotaria magnacalcarata]|uniref:Uncharacterized protein n=1 Tax=Rotaria magnacalcarata TaxID=392030 RepID=A0A816WR57_9BILA|nr:unnamed protein product [Rotaria magnacalcarata]CAF4232837.1 unnamed protein product [Rotaria magnacalcarata]
MFQTDILIDTSVLPSNIMSLCDDNLIDFVKEEAGHAAATLLELQGINSVKSVLMTDDVCAIMNMKSKSLDVFKNKYGYMQDDGTCIIQPGAKGNIEYLMSLLKTKCVDDAKLVKSSKQNQLSSSLTTTTNTSSTIRKPTSSILSDSSPETILSNSYSLSLAEHKSYIIDTLNNWCKNNKSKDNNERFSLVEGKDYFISLQNDSTRTLKCNIKWSCEKWTTLVFRRGKFQLSNFYRHLQGLINECPALKKNINNPPVSSPSSTHNHQPLTTSDNVLQQIASPNLIPIIPPSDTIQSNSTSVATSSISKSTEDDETCDENIIEQPSSLKTKRQLKRKVQTLESSHNTRESAKRTRRR